MRLYYFIVILLLTSFQLQAQIKLDNPSFEDEPQDATTPHSWNPCAPGSTPDIMPGPWGVYHQAEDGDTFIGLITRKNNTWESIGQGLSAPIKAKECYSFSLNLARSATYSGYNRPLRLRIWACEKPCQKAQLLAESATVAHTDWKEYEFYFFPKKDYNYIILEAYYVKETTTFYQGNILLDNCSTINYCNRASID